MRGRIEIDANLCKLCLYCVEACPKGIIEANGASAPSVIRPDECQAAPYALRSALR